MDLEVRRVPVAADGSFIADAEAMAEACDARTILLMGSVPSFPFGTVDPIAALSEIALEKKIWLHVDACVGGWFAPFARMNGVPVPDFDFALPGVCSISADLHKFAFAAKGASTVLFRSLDLHRHMAFEMSGWSGAPMKTPTLAGTRPGGAIAAAWAMLQVLGKDGYQRLHGLVCETRSAIEAALRQRGFEILGRPLLPIVAFRHPDFEALALTSELRKRGWFTSMNTDPPSLHLMLSPKHAEVVNDYLTALDASMQALRTGETAGRIEVRYS
jgi:glutamate/tyrosine decarboxylase-like PLP-dependent enzyme